MMTQTLQRTATARGVAKYPPLGSAHAQTTRPGARLGNQARLRHLATGGPTLQAKLAIGAVNDPLEHEADAVADQVMRGPGSGAGVSFGPPAVSRKCAACEASAQVDEDAAPAVARAVSGGGRGMDADTRGFMESRFGRDFGDVRIHTDDQAAESARSVGARAFTVGRDVVFGHGEYQPRGEAGRRLLAHELTHTVQQGAVGAPTAVARSPLNSTSPIAITAGAGPALRMSPECPYTYGNCKGNSCVPKNGKGTGFCAWVSIAAGCQCYAADQPRLREFVETVLLAALLAIGVIIALEALAALIACFASGACEIGILIGALGLAGALLVIRMLKENPAAPPVVASLDAPSTSETVPADTTPASAETPPATDSSMATS